MRVWKANVPGRFGKPMRVKVLETVVRANDDFITGIYEYLSRPSADRKSCEIAVSIDADIFSRNRHEAN